MIDVFVPNHSAPEMPTSGLVSVLTPMSTTLMSLLLSPMASYGAVTSTQPPTSNGIVRLPSDDLALDLDAVRRRHVQLDPAARIQRHLPAARARPSRGRVGVAGRARDRRRRGPGLEVLAATAAGRRTSSNAPSTAAAPCLLMPGP